MNTELEEKKCLACGKKIKGRVDKKFCDDYCRNNYNNAQKGDTNNYIRNVNNALKKNRTILSTILTDALDMKKTTKEILQQKGFNFKYHTHLYKNQKGNVYYYCYEYGYLPLENEWYLVVKRHEE